MKNVLRRLARRLGYEVVSSRHAMLRYLQDPPRSVLDYALLRTFTSLERLSFIQIGANDGVRCDPIRHHVLRHRWSGLLIEPVSRFCRELEQNYAGVPGLDFLNAAVDGTAGERSIFQLQSDRDDLPDWSHGLASFSPERLHRAAKDFGLPATAVVSERVSTVTWHEVWQRFGTRRCDVLVVDAEGFDLALLRGAALASHRPRLIQFEHACVTPAERVAFHGELIALGYDLMTGEGDTIALLPRDHAGRDSLPPETLPA